MMSEAASENKTVLVTGANGFVGQHVVKLLQLRAPYIEEIRVVDLQPFSKRLEYEDRISVKSYVGDICDINDMYKACRGVDAVIHVAGVVSFGTYPDVDAMQRVNVQGTQRVVEACIETSVPRLVFTSTIDVVVGYDPIVSGTEDSCVIPTKFLFKGYPDTKYAAECIVRDGNGKKLRNGETLHTLALRCNVMYGELDPYFVINALKAAKKYRGELPQVGDGSALFQQAYVGNAAWAHVVAIDALRRRPLLGGGIYFIPDDTPLGSLYDFVRPFLESRGYGVSHYRLPFFLTYYALRAVELGIWLVSPLWRVELGGGDSRSLFYTNMSLYFDGAKGRRELEYEPVYTAAESLEASLKYYKDCEI